jgi:hypothetical protein
VLRNGNRSATRTAKVARAKSISVRVKPRRACILSIKRIYHLVRYGSYLWEFTPKKEGFLPDGDGGGLGFSE